MPTTTDNSMPGLQLPNPYLSTTADDNLSHLDISTTSCDIPKTFGDVKFVCVGGSATRMEHFANFMMDELGITSGKEKLQNLSGTDRYVLFKAGPVLVANHGIGVPSMSVIIHELLKLVYYAGCHDVTFIRIGTCGGIGIPPGSVIVSNAALNGKLDDHYKVVVLGRSIRRPVTVDQALAKEVFDCASPDDNFRTIMGKTYCTDDFYEGQARTHGAVCDITDQDEIEFVNTLHKAGVVNIEMESAGFIALCHKAGTKSAVVCVTLLDRLSSEDLPQETSVWQTRPQELVARFIKQRLAIKTIKY